MGNVDCRGHCCKNDEIIERKATSDTRGPEEEIVSRKSISCSLGEPEELVEEELGLQKEFTRRRSCVEQQPLKFTIVSARNLRNADGILPFWGKSDPYCILEIKDKPLSRFVTEVVMNNLNPVWNQSGQFADFEDGDTLTMNIWDKDWMKKDDFLGYCTLSAKDFHPDGFDGEVLLQEAGRNRKAYIKVRIEPMVKAMANSQTLPAAPSLKATSTARSQNLVSQKSSLPAVQPRLRSPPNGSIEDLSKLDTLRVLPPSGNANVPTDYDWLEEAFSALSSNQAATLACKNLETGELCTPMFFVIGGCPNSFCGMQAVMFCADKRGDVDFWWVKPSKSDPSKLERETLNRHSSGKHKNDPGRSKPFFQPLADLFAKNALVSSEWRFGIEHAGTDGKVPRAYIDWVDPSSESDVKGQRCYLQCLWQEDWTSNPFSRSKYVKGKLVYHKQGKSEKLYMRQYEIRDGVAYIQPFEEGPTSATLPPASVKTLWEDTEAQ
eukprot:TRINITY_DN7792_c0_g6_i1.p1 TRINITY_DN7792_c0_g6~~TRINITY_DN7792_c0_g6_i1.p1  ORF type:complete len:493 (+),score=105.25 TRINITY_DN7792_c0_g6_i1:122-1600(+)